MVVFCSICCAVSGELGEPGSRVSGICRTGRLSHGEGNKRGRVMEERGVDG